MIGDACVNELLALICSGCVFECPCSCCMHELLNRCVASFEVDVLNDVEVGKSLYGINVVRAPCSIANQEVSQVVDGITKRALWLCRDHELHHEKGQDDALSRQISCSSMTGVCARLPKDNVVQDGGDETGVGATYLGVLDNGRYVSRISGGFVQR